MKDVSALCYRGGVDGVAGGPAVDPGFEAEFPTIFAFLVLATLPSGKAGKPGTLTVFPEDGVFKIRLSDRNRGADLWASGPTIRDAMIALEALFSEPFVPWRRAAYLGGGKAK